jgi:hypothetical protein
MHSLDVSINDRESCLPAVGPPRAAAPGRGANCLAPRPGLPRSSSKQAASNAPPCSVRRLDHRPTRPPSQSGTQPEPPPSSTARRSPPERGSAELPADDLPCAELGERVQGPSRARRPRPRSRPRASAGRAARAGTAPAVADAASGYGAGSAGVLAARAHRSCGRACARARSSACATPPARCAPPCQPPARRHP